MVFKKIGYILGGLGATFALSSGNSDANIENYVNKQYDNLPNTTVMVSEENNSQNVLISYIGNENTQNNKLVCIEDTLSNDTELVSDKDSEEKEKKEHKAGDVIYTIKSLTDELINSYDAAIADKKAIITTEEIRNLAKQYTKAKELSEYIKNDIGVIYADSEKEKKKQEKKIADLQIDCDKQLGTYMDLIRVVYEGFKDKFDISFRLVAKMDGRTVAFGNTEELELKRTYNAEDVLKELLGKNKKGEYIFEVNKDENIVKMVSYLFENFNGLDMTNVEKANKQLSENFCGLPLDKKMKLAFRKLILEEETIKGKDKDEIIYGLNRDVELNEKPVITALTNNNSMDRYEIRDLKFQFNLDGEGIDYSARDRVDKIGGLTKENDELAKQVAELKEALKQANSIKPKEDSEKSKEPESILPGEKF